MKKRSRFSLKTSEEYISLKKEVKTTNKYFEDLVVKNNIDTVYKIWKNSVAVYGSKNCLGTRYPSFEMIKFL